MDERIFGIVFCGVLQQLGDQKKFKENEGKLKAKDSEVMIFICIYNINRLPTKYILLNLVIRFSYILGGLAAGIYVIPPARQRFDEKIFKHLRNYNATLGQYNRFNTQEEFYEMLGNVGNGVLTFFSD